MYQFSRAIYREVAPHISCSRGDHDRLDHEQVLRACESAIERLANDPHYFARPARSLFHDIRGYFPVGAQLYVHRVVTRYVAYADEYLSRLPRRGYDANGAPLQCRATTRKGTPCQRMPLPHNGYCPSHQHLAETENAEALAA